MWPTSLVMRFPKVRFMTNLSISRILDSDSAPGRIQRQCTGHSRNEKRLCEEDPCGDREPSLVETNFSEDSTCHNLIVFSDIKVLFYVDSLCVEVHSQVLKGLLSFDSADTIDRRVYYKQFRIVLAQLKPAPPEISRAMLSHPCLRIGALGRPPTAGGSTLKNLR